MIITFHHHHHRVILIINHYLLIHQYQLKQKTQQLHLKSNQQKLRPKLVRIGNQTKKQSSGPIIKLHENKYPFAEDVNDDGNWYYKFFIKQRDTC